MGKRLARLVSLLAVMFAAACGSEGGAGSPPPAPGPGDGDGAAAPPVAPGDQAVVLSFGADVLPAVRDRVADLLTKSAPLPVRSLDAAEAPPALAEGSIVLSFGDTASTRAVVDAASIAKLGPEGFVVRSGVVAGDSVIAAAGNAPAKETSAHGNLGTAYAAYALLEELGFAFLHPLAPVAPPKFAIPATSLDLHEAPAWRIRGMHLHTMHPLELTDLLEGFGPGGTSDQAGWAARLPEWDRFLEWMLANRQNRVEWVLLWADSWADFADSPERQQRLATLVSHAHDRGIAAGADAPLALSQQHTFRLVRNTGDLEDEKIQIRQRLDWIYAAGFDFFSTESGSTEFTHPDPARMLAWMNEAATYSKTAHGAPAYIKAHCSTGQTAEGFTDPKTGGPLNFNFLPHYADKSLGIMPHTVEIYGLADPAPTYGNTDFTYMKDFLQQEAGTRETIWHPETAYWITYDIDVPLFLPVYAERRLDDLRILGFDEKAGKAAKMDGQMIFSSGWEWGYWLNDVVAARAAWNPHLEIGSPREAFRTVLAPVTRALGAAAHDASEWIADTATAERDLLVLGKVNGVIPSDPTRRNGMAYLEGFDAMADVASLGGALGIQASPITQPARVGLIDIKNPLHAGPDYDEITALLGAMDASFGDLADRGAALAASTPPEARDLIDDLADASRMTALRAEQMHGLYDYVAGPTAARPARLATARAALDSAAAIVAQREKRYRVEADRIAGWRDNPTAYEFTYLWPVRSLYFWWRDEGKAVDSPRSPCYLNIMSPADIALGEGVVADSAAAIRTALGTSAATECLSAPASQPSYPQDGLRTRP